MSDELNKEKYSADNIQSLEGMEHVHVHRGCRSPRTPSLSV